MGIPYFTGTHLPFIASIVISTIQLGATVGYSILMTTRYHEERSYGRTDVYQRQVYTGADLAHFTRLGAAGVQLATRFITTYECDASQG